MVYNLTRNSSEENLVYIKLERENFTDQLIHLLFEMNIQSLLVEGGSKTLQCFIDNNLWDEGRIIVNENLIIENGIAAPETKNFTLKKRERYLNDVIHYYKNSS